MNKSKHIRVGNIILGNDRNFVFIGGPDSLESRKHALSIAKQINNICQKLDISYIFKASYDKANRTSVKSFRGVGIKEGLKILKNIQTELNIPVTTDVHSPNEAQLVSKVVDLIQIPALLSRQTDLLVAAGKTKKPINIKKGQFIAPQNIDQVINKVKSTRNNNIIVTERGYMFGYNNVVADMRSIAIMKQTGYPVIFDASHTVQYPSGDGASSSGDRTLIPSLARASIGVGVAGLFMEVHPNPDKAPVDGPNSLKLTDLANTLSVLKQIDNIVKNV